MSEMEQLHQGVAIATQAAQEARNQAGNAQELAERIASTGQATGFGNDPMLIVLASEQLQTALGGLTAGINALEQAVNFVLQARSS